MVVPRFSFSNCSVPIPYCSAPFSTVPYRSIPFGTVPYCSIPFRTVLYHSLLCVLDLKQLKPFVNVDNCKQKRKLLFWWGEVGLSTIYMLIPYFLVYNPGIVKTTKLIFAWFTSKKELSVIKMFCLRWKNYRSNLTWVLVQITAGGWRFCSQGSQGCTKCMGTGIG